MNLDIGTVVFCSLLVGSALMAFSWSLALSAGSHPWRVDWAWGNTALFFGVGLYLTQGSLTPWISVILSNGLAVLGYHLLEQGLRRLAGRPAPKAMPWILAVLFLIPFLIFTFVWDVYLVRVGVYSALIVAVWFRVALLLRKLPEHGRNPALVRTLMGFCLVILVFHGGRALIALGENRTNLLGPSNTLALLFLVSMLIIVAWSLGFITLDIFRSQWQLQRALETRDRMMQLIAHDLRGPIGSQVGLLDLMKGNGQCREDEGEMLDLLAVSSRNSYDLLENLLDWAQNQKGSLELHPEDLDARDLLVQASAPYDTAARVKQIAVRINAEPGEVRTDRKTVTTVLRNLISNAVKFTPRGGEVRLSFRRENGQGAFLVEDTGQGIPPALLESLKAGVQTPWTASTPGTEKETGTGLGLALCREFIRLNGGELRFASSSAGTVATVALP